MIKIKNDDYGDNRYFKRYMIYRISLMQPVNNRNVVFSEKFSVLLFSK